MRIGSCDTQTSVALIAEVGNNHEGSASRARALVDVAFESGANAVKLQTFIPELYVSSIQSDRLAMLRRFSLSQDVILSLMEEHATEGRVVFSTPFDLQSADLLARARLIKISSGDITYEQLIRHCAALGPDLILSTGGSSLDEVRHAASLVSEARHANGVLSELAILHCVSAYPAPSNAANLRCIATLQQEFPEVTVGYSDHTLGIGTSLLAAAAGARIIEKHFTLDKLQSEFRDHALSANPSEFRQLRIRLDDVEESLGDGIKAAQSCESDSLPGMRRSLTAARDLSAGTRIAEEDVVIVRPATGLPPGMIGTILGRALLRDVMAGQALREEDIV